MPYTGLFRELHPFPAVSLYHGCLVACNVVEPYHPDRVLRQFGYVQTIPCTPIAADVHVRWEKKSLSTLLPLVPYFIVWDSHVLSADRLGNIAQLPWECAPDYMQWYTAHSHPLVQNPERRSPQFTVTSPARVPDAWEMITSVRNLVQPPVQRWRLGDRGMTADELAEVLDRTYMIVGGPDTAGPSTGGRDEAGPSTSGRDEAGTSTGGTRRRRRRN